MIMMPVTFCKDCVKSHANGGSCWRHVELGANGYCSKGKDKPNDRQKS